MSLGAPEEGRLLLSCWSEIHRDRKGQNRIEAAPVCAWGGMKHFTKSWISAMGDAMLLWHTFTGGKIIAQWLRTLFEACGVLGPRLGLRQLPLESCPLLFSIYRLLM